MGSVAHVRESPPARILGAVIRWITVPAMAQHLALFRVVVFGMLALAPFGYAPGLPAVLSSYRVAQLPAELVIAPEGLWWVPHSVLSPWGVLAAGAILAISGGLAALGWRTRVTGWVAVLAAIWVLGVPQFYGKVTHYHHIIWFAAILASSPSDDVWRIGKRPPSSTVAGSEYGFPLRVTWLLFGILYLSAGLPKWQDAGLRWAFSDNLRNRIWIKETLNGVDLLTPPEALLQLAAVAVLLFEVLFLVGVLFRRTRPWVVVFALMFHLATPVMMWIAFASLLPCFVAFASWRTSSDSSPGSVDRLSGLQVGTCVVVVVLAFAACVFRWGDAWPFASYPSFSGVQSTPETAQLTATLNDSGTHLPISVFSRWIPVDRATAIARQVDAGEADRMLDALGRELASSPRLRDIRQVTLWRTVLSARPENRGQPIGDPQVVAVIDLEGD